jgi:dTDP-4-amino-4,6-dideoxygalactose transaminase
MSGKEMKYIQEAFDGNWIAPLGPNVDGFEKDLENYLGQESHVAVVSTGTAALHLALAMLGVEKDDFVICQSLTFAASANPIIYLGGIPVFVDSEKDTWNLCPIAVEDAIKACINKGKKTKSYYYGLPLWYAL